MDEFRDLFNIPEDGIFEDDDDSDAWSSCDSVSTVGEVSLIMEDFEDDTFADGPRAGIEDDREILSGTGILTEIREESPHSVRVEEMPAEIQGDVEMIEADEMAVEERDRTQSEVATGVEEDMDVTEENNGHSNVLNTADKGEVQSEVERDRMTETCSSSHNPGFVLVIDNIDMNVRRSDQRVDRTTSSYHFCHGYALLNRVDSTLLEDNRAPSGVLSLDNMLPTQADLENILGEFQMFVSRYSVKSLNVFESCTLYTFF